MKAKLTCASVLLVALYSFPVWAVDDPQVDEGAQQFDQMQCVDDATQNCINDACLNSEEIDCEDNCKKLAQDKCQQQIDE
ncbi:MAG: hypothetical protein EPN84_04760 [Legionella sp.]|nr:MAG: hypothetical protein EPN84_04760 [Legionella sp.]